MPEEKPEKKKIRIYSAPTNPIELAQRLQEVRGEEIDDYYDIDIQHIMNANIVGDKYQRYNMIDLEIIADAIAIYRITKDPVVKELLNWFAAQKVFELAATRSQGSKNFDALNPLGRYNQNGEGFGRELVEEQKEKEEEQGENPIAKLLKKIKKK